jgi:subtilisin family serine protease
MRTVSKVIANCSWKTSGDVAVIRNAIETAAQNGVIFVTSAGNESSAGPHYPSDYSKTIEGVFSVAALAPNNRKASYSNYSTTVSICAPGGDGSPLDSNDIYCADLNNTHAYTAGTSFAAPHLSGTIALMLSISPRMSFGDIKDILEKTALSLKAENPELYPLLGCGKLDAGKAVKAAADQTMPSQPRQPENPEDPANHEVPGNSEQPAGDILGPKIDIVIGNENLTTSTSTAPANETCIDRMTERVGDELRNMSSSLENGDFVRITLESNGSVTILDYQI